MRKTSRWNLYVAGYTLLCGVPLLFFPHRVPFISYTPNDEVWVRLCGMCLLAFAFYNFFISRERQAGIVLASIINQFVFGVVFAVWAFLRATPMLYAVSGVVLLGALGAALSFRKERLTHVPEPLEKMPRTAGWNLYVTGYTLVYGLATAVFPTLLLPLLGFARPDGLWVRITGLCFLTLCFFNLVTYGQKGSPGNIWAIMLVRAWFVANLLVLAALGYPTFLVISAGIVGLGVVGTIVTFCREWRPAGAKRSR